jgi:hypothetical protein
VRLWLVGVLGVAFLSGSAAARDGSEAADALRNGFALLEEAARLRVSDPRRSEGLAADAAALIQAGLPDGGIDRPNAQRALGNAHLLAGDLGRAVLAYRRAVSAAAEDPLARDSLAYARSLVGAETGAVPVSESWRARLGAVVSVVPRGVVFWAAGAVFVGACWVVAMRIVSILPRRVVAPAVTLGVLAGVSLGVLAAEPAFDRSVWGVVLEETVGRTGPHGEVYPPALDRAVPAGAEVRVVESRDGWLLVAVGAERAWLPGRSVERVRPGAP